MNKKSVLFLSLGFAVISASIAFKSTTYVNKTNDTVKQSASEVKEYGEQFMDASSYLNSLRANLKTGTVSVQEALQAREAVEHMQSVAAKKTAVGLNWTEVGPDNIGGRIRALLIDKTNSNKIYAGGVAGGLWYSADQGLNWSIVNGTFENLTVSCIAQAANGDIFIGTGEGWALPYNKLPIDNGFVGGGMWKISTNGTVTRLTNTIPSASSKTVDWAYVNKLATSPTDANKIWAATSTGIKVSTDGGTNWANAVNISGNDVVDFADDVEVASDGSVFCSMKGKVYFSTNGLAGSFAQIASSTFTGNSATIGRIELAVAPSDPKYIYASVAKPAPSTTSSSSIATLYNLYQSTDKGVTWTVIVPGGSTTFEFFGKSAGLGWYDNTLLVYPDNKDQILIGGVALWRWDSNNGLPYKIDDQNYSPYNTKYVHSSKHAICFAPNNTTTFFVATDGGVYRTTNGGNSYTAIDKGLNITQFYSAAAASNSNAVIGGSSNNGAVYINGTNGKTGSSFMQLDAGKTEISFLKPDAFFHSGPFGRLYRSLNAASVDSGFYTPRIKANTSFGVSSFAAYVTPLAQWESYNDVNSIDSITFKNTEITEIGSLTKGTLTDGSKSTFNYTLTPTQKFGKILPGTVKIVCGSQVITDDSNGNLIGDITTDANSNTINYNTNDVKVHFKTTPIAGLAVVTKYYQTFTVGDKLLVNSKTNNTLFGYILDTTLLQNDSVHIQDIVQHKIAVGFNCSNGFGIYVSRKMLDFKNKPNWVLAGGVYAAKGDQALGETRSLAFSPDGTHLYFTTYNASPAESYVYRIDNLNQFIDSTDGDVTKTTKCKLVTTRLGKLSGRTITSLAVDPNDDDRIVVTCGNYGSTSYVYYMNNATSVTTQTDFSAFTDVTGNLPAIPVYDALFDKTNGNTVLLGTEYGIYATADITQQSSTQWSEENNGIPRVPVMRLRQELFPPYHTANSGIIYAATFGRGIWKSTTLATPVGIVENNSITKSIQQSGIVAYPNPTTDLTYIAFNLANITTVTVNIYSLDGKLAYSTRKQNLPSGQNKIEVSTAELTAGTYIIQVSGESINASTRMVVSK